MSTHIQSSLPAAIAVKQAPSIARSMLVPSTNRDWKWLSLWTLFSLCLHLLVLGTIGLIVFSNPTFVNEFFTTVTDNEEPIEAISEHSLFPVEKIEESAPDHVPSNIESSLLEFETKGPIAFDFGEGPLRINASNDVTTQRQTTSTNAVGMADPKIGNEMSGRMSAKSKASLVQKFGGTPASEAAVIAGLNWLSAHQLPNGSWSFEHSKHPDCKGQCSQTGSLKNCPNGATGLAVLTFLGAGHTHFGGDYQSQVRRGIEFLQNAGHQSTSPKGIDFRGKNSFGIEGMYVQGICAIALSECAAMTHDSRLRKHAEGAVQFIVNSQNKSDGGWRYHFGQPGDTSVVGWQIMALKSADNAKIDFPHSAFQGAKKFLNSAQTERGAYYVYLPSGPQRMSEPRPSMTAVGLLCRMYMGWDRNDPQLAVGVKYLSDLGPQSGDMYFNYYATQVLHHWGADEWTKWNDVMREQLILTQRSVRSGHSAGSWDLADEHGDAGGRLYMTCLATMTLEVYYRHLPLYDRDHLKVEF
jgi:hypothetical protein